MDLALRLTLTLAVVNLVLILWFGLRTRSTDIDAKRDALLGDTLRQQAERLERELRDEVGRSAQSTRLELGNALALFQQIREPALEAVTRYQLGRVFHEQCKWDEAERHYKEAAVLREAAGDWSVAAQLWSQLARLCQDAGQPESAETWYRKATECNRLNGNATQLAHQLSRLAAVLHDQPGSLEEAHYLVDQVLAAAHHTPDPLVASSWDIYGVVAEIIEKEALAAADGARRRRAPRARRRRACRRTRACRSCGSPA